MICLICGKEEKEHHTYTPVVAPAGCKCDPYDWNDIRHIPVICDSFLKDKDFPEICSHCEHNEE